MRVLVAGGAGFIGSAYVRRRLDAHPEDSVRVLDKLTYAGRRENLDGLPADRLELIEGDIAEAGSVAAAVEDCDAIRLPHWREGLAAYLRARERSPSMTRGSSRIGGAA